MYIISNAFYNILRLGTNCSTADISDEEINYKKRELVKITDNNTFSTDVILTEQELSKELKISSKKLSVMRKKGELPSYTYFYVGKSIRYKKGTVIEYFVTKDKLV